MDYDDNDKDILLSKIMQLKNEFVLKNGKVMFNPNLLQKSDRNIYAELSNLLDYKNLDRIIYNYLEEKRKYKDLEYYDEVTVFAKANYERSISELHKVLEEEDVIPILEKWFFIYENEFNYNNLLADNEVDNQVISDDWAIPDEEWEMNEAKKRKH